MGYVAVIISNGYGGKGSRASILSTPFLLHGCCCNFLWPQILSEFHNSGLRPTQYLSSEFLFSASVSQLISVVCSQESCLTPCPQFFPYFPRPNSHFGTSLSTDLPEPFSCLDFNVLLFPSPNLFSLCYPDELFLSLEVHNYFSLVKGIWKEKEDKHKIF